MKFQEECKIVEKKIYNNYLFLKLETKEIAKNAKPGQFVNIRVSENYDPLLRRPFSISDCEENFISLLIQIKGRATKILSDRKEGENLNIIGPLGNSFPLSEKDALFIAGGIGIAPFPFLFRYIKNAKMLFGVKSSNFLPDMKVFSGMDILISSDDGSVGEKGTVVDLLVKEDFLKKTIYVCGPNPLFKALNKVFCEEVEAYYSLENYMACGFGACKGCVVKTIYGNKLVCKDGPIFKWNEVIL